MNDTPQVERLSIIVPTIGKSPYLDDALHSVLSNAPADAEILLFLNGCPELVATLSPLPDARLRICSCANRLPPADSWNTAVGLASGAHIVFIGDDDRLDSSFASWWRARDTSADFVIMGIHLIDAIGNPLPFPPNQSGPIDPNGAGWSILTSAISSYLGGVIFSKQKFILAGGFVDLKMSNGWFIDTYLWVRLIRLSTKPVVDNCPTWQYRINPQQMGYMTQIDDFVRELDTALETLIQTLPYPTAKIRRRLRRHLIYARALSNLRNTSSGQRKVDFASALAITVRYCGLADTVAVVRGRVLGRLSRRRRA